MGVPNERREKKGIKEILKVIKAENFLKGYLKFLWNCISLNDRYIEEITLERADS